MCGDGGFGRCCGKARVVCERHLMIAIHFLIVLGPRELNTCVGILKALLELRDGCHFVNKASCCSTAN